MVTIALKYGVVAARSPRSGGDRRVDSSSDAASQYTSIAFAETLVLEGIVASIGSVGDAYDNALAETTTGLFKTEALGPASAFRSGAVAHPRRCGVPGDRMGNWYNKHRLLGYVPPVGYDSAYYAQLSTSQPTTTSRRNRSV
jgi:transposase InsO family protein